MQCWIWKKKSYVIRPKMRREGTTKDWDEKDHYKEAFELIMEQDVYKFRWAEKKGHKNKCIRTVEENAVKYKPNKILRMNLRKKYILFSSMMVTISCSSYTIRPYRRHSIIEMTEMIIKDE